MYIEKVFQDWSSSCSIHNLNIDIYLVFTFYMYLDQRFFCLQFIKGVYQSIFLSSVCMLKADYKRPTQYET